MTPKQFIQGVLIDEMADIVDRHPYISFALMGIGIEFLGKCINEFDDWDEKFRSKTDFELAINKLDSFKRYIPLLTSHLLHDNLRNGFAHSFVPKGKLALSSKDETAHLVFSTTQVNLKAEDLYADFKNACLEVIKMTTFASNKMDKPLLSVPDLE